MSARARPQLDAGPPSTGPPWILGQRGAPLEAPENTLAGLRRALDLGLDGVQYDLRACAGGELVLMADETLERTTDGRGRVGERTLPELFHLDAGGGFDKRFVGEPIPLFDEALELSADPGREPPLHLVLLREPDLVDDVARRVREVGRRLAVRVASPSRDVCRSARDAGLAAMLVAPEPDEGHRRFVRDERLAACAAGPRAWSAAGGQDGADWDCERWAIGVDAPDDLLAACRAPLFGFTTAEPRRALAVRALVALAPQDQGPHPLRAPELPVDPEGAPQGGGEWRGAWRSRARVRNPFPFDVRAGCQLFVRRGAFEVAGLPARFTLAPDEEVELSFELKGGSWSPGGDPLLAVLYRWRAGPGRPAGRLLLDAPLVRVRTVAADEVARRVRMLRESPAQSPATMTVRRRGRELVVAIEDPGGLRDTRTLVHLAGRTEMGGAGLRLRLPRDFDRRAQGVPFCCGFVGRDAHGGNGRVLRRWAGGLPEGPHSGAPGRLVPQGRG